MAIHLFPPYTPIFKDLSQGSLPSILHGWQEMPLHLNQAGTHYGFIFRGHATLHRQSKEGTYSLSPGMYFCLPEEGFLEGESASGLLMTRFQHRGLFSLGGPIESAGRLAYIDGGTTTVLIPPLLSGDPCCHALYFPPGVDQTLHTHPSFRFGIIVEGQGEVETPNQTLALELGSAVLIEAHTLHKFRTRDQSLTLVLFHPDSEFGFTHQTHPMIQRTYVNGIEASQLTDIQTPQQDLDINII